MLQIPNPKKSKLAIISNQASPFLDQFKEAFATSPWNLNV
jgi:hypothetical protein